ncbi:MAG: hypothetical protein PHX30_04960 [Candidatus Pacebacteria bacterium]|jgi:hypothetical protein|nr:hypothetical protein [Candidatus Paceibacterota bacterium]
MTIETKLLKKDSGQVIMFIIFVVLFLVLFVSLYISRSLLKQTKASVGAVSSVQSYYIADSGTENVLYYLSGLDPAEPQPTAGTSIVLDNLFVAENGIATAVVSDASPTTLKIDIIGTYKNTSRAIQLFW